MGTANRYVAYDHGYSQPLCATMGTANRYVRPWVQPTVMYGHGYRQSLCTAMGTANRYVRPWVQPAVMYDHWYSQSLCTAMGTANRYMKLRSLTSQWITTVSTVRDYSLLRNGQSLICGLWVVRMPPRAQIRSIGIRPHPVTTIGGGRAGTKRLCVETGLYSGTVSVGAINSRVIKPRTLGTKGGQRHIQN
ncbi:hypothetical protein Btru_060694 [Bulinus truncatus]|nr:hypothetical protein Btru_060694 [Bulinus truncatus]